MPVGTYTEAAYAIRDSGFWSVWALRALLALGAAHVLAGIIFFFAFNWADMPVYAKFAVVQSAIALTALTALIAGLDRPAGQALLVAASVLTGVVLAVFGQVYQTGADAFELFVSWTLLIAPWVLISRSAAHWLVWLVVVSLAVGLYCEQILVPLRRMGSEQVLLVVGAVPVLALVLREIAVRMEFAWLSAVWTRYVLVFAALACFFIPAVSYLFEFGNTWIAAVLFVAVVAAALVVYSGVLRDFGGFALAVGAGAFFLMAVGGKLIGETIGYDEENFAVLGSLAILTLWCVGVTAGMAKLLARLRVQFGEAGR